MFEFRVVEVASSRDLCGHSLKHVLTSEELQTETDDNGDFSLAAAPGIYSVLGNKNAFAAEESSEKLCSPDHITHVLLLLNPHLPRGVVRIALTWGELWWNSKASLSPLELVIQTPSGCLIRRGRFPCVCMRLRACWKSLESSLCRDCDRSACIMCTYW